MKVRIKQVSSDEVIKSLMNENHTLKNRIDKIKIELEGANLEISMLEGQKDNANYYNDGLNELISVFEKKYHEQIKIRKAKERYFYDLEDFIKAKEIWLASKKSNQRVTQEQALLSAIRQNKWKLGLKDEEISSMLEELQQDKNYFKSMINSFKKFLEGEREFT